jgi:hypothetical protein
MNDLFGYISSWSVLKWIVLVLIAGFIGQFGKMAANAIAAKIRAHRPEPESTPDTPIKPSVLESSPASPSAAPPDKKMLKAIAKAKKKEAKKKLSLSG